MIKDQEIYSIYNAYRAISVDSQLGFLVGNPNEGWNALGKRRKS